MSYIIWKRNKKEMGFLLKFAFKCTKAKYFTTREFRLSLIFKIIWRLGLILLTPSKKKIIKNTVMIAVTEMNVCLLWL